MRLKKLKDNQTYNVCLVCHSSKWDSCEGQISEPYLLFDESYTTKDVNKFLNAYGLKFEQMEDYTQHGIEDEKNRFTYTRIIKEENKQYLEDYDLYIEIATLNSEVLE